MFKFIILLDARVNIWLSQLGTLVITLSKTTKVTISSLSSILLVNQNELIIHSVVVIFKTHNTTLEWSILIDILLDLRVNKYFGLCWLG